MLAIDRIEVAFRVRPVIVSRGVLCADISLESINLAVDVGRLVWQDPDSPDCGCNDGMMYLSIPECEIIDELELMLCIDLQNGLILY